LTYLWLGRAKNEQLRTFGALLALSTTIEELHVDGGSYSAETFQPICQGLVQSQSVTTLRLVGCFLRGQGFNPLFRALFRTKLNLYSLQIERCYFEGGNFYDSLVENLSRKKSAFKKLVVDAYALEAIFDLSELLHAVVLSDLDSFLIGRVSCVRHFQLLVDNIPATKVRKLGLDIRYNGNNRKQQVLDAVKQNFFLRSVNEISDRSNLQLNHVDHRRLAFYMNRNERSAAWTENPATVPSKLCPEAIFMAQQASKESLFASLKALSGKGVGLSRGKRKRTRTTFYKPT